MITLKSEQDPFETWNKLIGPSKNGFKPKWLTRNTALYRNQFC